MNRLRELRIEKDLLQSDIAKIINKSDRAVGFYETGERDMSTETLSILADFFDVSIDYLLGKSDIRKSENISADDIDIACFDGLRGLNETNKQVAKNIIDGLLAKQQKDDEENKH